MIVITLTKVPASLRGVLTKWYQEVQTGVYVGNVSAKVRDLVWKRICRDIGQGQATMVYNAKNEFGYQFQTTRNDHQVIDFDGIPLMKHLKQAPTAQKRGFSDAAKRRMAQKMSKKVNKTVNASKVVELVAVDVETTGLNATTDAIISIGAVKMGKTGKFEDFDVLVKTKLDVPEAITELTGISNHDLDSHGISLTSALEQLKQFIGDLPICGYNLRFDDEFLTTGFEKNAITELTNRRIDLLPLVKKTNQFLDNYRLMTILSNYSIENPSPHHALSDATATLKLATKLIENGDLQI